MKKILKTLLISVLLLSLLVLPAYAYAGDEVTYEVEFGVLVAIIVFFGILLPATAFTLYTVKLLIGRDEHPIIAYTTLIASAIWLGAGLALLVMCLI